MLEFSHVLFKVDPFQTDAAVAAVNPYIQVSAHRQGQVVLGDLISLHQVWIGVVLTVKFGVIGNLAVQGQTGHDGKFHRFAVNHGHRARQS